MALEQVFVGRFYETFDGRELYIFEEWAAKDGELRVSFEVVGGPASGFDECSKSAFCAMAVRDADTSPPPH